VKAAWKLRASRSLEPAYVLGLDIGTSRVRVLLAERNENGSGRVLGVGHRPCRGLRRGELVDIEETVTSIKPAVEEAEVMAGVEVAEAWLGLSGGQVASINARASVMVNNPNRGVSEEDKRRVLNKVREEKLSEGCGLLHALAQDYDLDSRKGVLDPLKMTTRKLWVNAHLIEASDSLLADLARCVRLGGLDVRGFTLQSLAASRAVLYAEEMESGVLLIDIGGGTSDYAVFRHGILRHTGVLGVGGDHLSNDISIGLRIQIAQAEAVKIGYATAAEPDPAEDDACPLPPAPGEPATRVSRRRMYTITRSRLEEIFKLIRDDLEKEGVFSGLSSGAVLTGGGAMLSGIEEPAASILDLKVRVGTPWGLDGLEGVADGVDFSTVAGLVKYGIEQEALSGRPLRPRGPWGRFLAKYF